MVSSQNGDTQGGPLSPSDATVKNNQTRINFISKTKLNSVLIRNDQVRVIFWHLQAKLHQFRKCIVMLRTAQATRMFLVLIQIKLLASSLLQFYDAGKTTKKSVCSIIQSIGNTTILCNWYRCSQNLRTNEGKNWQKIKEQSASTQNLLVLISQVHCKMFLK